MNSWTIRAHELHTHQANILVNVLLSIDQDDPILDEYKTRHIGSPAGDEQKLRGIPVVGAPGVSGTIPGTNPPDKLLSRERWRNNR